MRAVSSVKVWLCSGDSRGSMDGQRERGGRGGNALRA
jgi:hypothetical protein